MTSILRGWPAMIESVSRPREGGLSIPLPLPLSGQSFIVLDALFAGRQAGNLDIQEMDDPPFSSRTAQPRFEQAERNTPCLR